MSNEKDKPTRPPLTTEEVLRRMLKTPPKPHDEMVKRKKQPAKKKGK